MASLDVRSASGASAGTIEVDDAFFAVQPNVPVLHQVVTAQLAAARRGTQSTKTRAEVSGGGAKPFRQKGTGRARQGSTRAPHWQGGGVALGPKPRSYRQRTPKKMIRLALASALSDRASQGKVVVVDEWAFTAPSTKAAVKALADLGIEERALVVVRREDDATVKSFRNLPSVQLIFVTELNAYDVLINDWVIFTRDVLPGKKADAQATAEPAAAEAPAASTPEAETPAAETPEAGTPEAGTLEAATPAEDEAGEDQ